MTDTDGAPERVWCGPDGDDGWRWPMASKFPEARLNVAYVRSDLFDAEKARADRAEAEVQRLRGAVGKMKPRWSMTSNMKGWQ